MTKLIEDESRFRSEIFDEKLYGTNKVKGIVVDIGAHVGLYAEYVHKYADKIYCIEPNYNNYKSLVKRVIELQMGNVRCFNFAIGNSNGKRGLYSARSDGGYTTTAEGGQWSYDSEVEAKTLEQFMTDEGIKKIDVLKVDCEGCENEIFTDDFARIADKIKKVVGEIHLGNETTLKVLGEHGFKIEKTGSNTYLATR